MIIAKCALEFENRKLWIIKRNIKTSKNLKFDKKGTSCSLLKIYKTDMGQK